MIRPLYFRLKGIIVGAAFILIGSFMIFTVGGEWLTGMQSRSWERVEAVIVTSRGIETHTVPEVDFRYSYQVDGRSYESSELSFKKKTQVDVRDIPAFLQQHPEGGKISVYYNPKHPGQAIVEPGVPTAGILFVLMPALFVVLGPLLIWGSVNGAIVRFCEERGLWYR